MKYVKLMIYFTEALGFTQLVEGCNFHLNCVKPMLISPTSGEKRHTKIVISSPTTRIVSLVICRPCL